VGACGTKFGKTYGCSIRLVKQAWDNKGSLNWWVAPSYSQSKIAYNLVKRLLPKDTYAEQKTDLRLVLLEPDGAEHSAIEFKSGDDPDKLRGFAVNFFVVDEAARISWESFVSVLTTVTQTRGKGIIISTPKGRGWFYDVYRRGEKFDVTGQRILQDGEDDPYPEWRSVRLPTWANPHVGADAIKELKRNLPDDVFRQEVAAEFIDGSAGVFRSIRDCIRGELQPPIPGHHYVMGVDLARLRDFSVLTVGDMANNNVVHWERFNDTSWDVQYRRIIDCARRYNAIAIVDSTGIGDPIVNTLSSAGIRLDPYKIGSSSAKKQLVDKLRVNIEQQKVSFPNIPTLVKELEDYEYKFSESGVVSFSAPRGRFDDSVISLALMNWGASREPFTYRYKSVRGI